MKSMSKWKWLLVISTLVLGLLLHLHNYEYYPQRGATSDEYTYSFLGVSLLTKHVPISWSYFDKYQHKQDLTIRHLYFPIVYPYFDHPPLNGIFVGGWALLNGQNTFEKIDLKTIRLVPIYLSVLSSLLLFLLAKKFFGFKSAFWALLIYSTTTIFVISGRIALAENLLTPLLLLSIYLFSLWEKKITVWQSILLGILSGMSFWTKELGIVTFFTLFFFFLSQKIKLKYLFIFSLISIASFLLYIVYGTYFGADVFWKIITVQGSRNIGPETLWLLLLNPILVNKPYFDGWYFLGFTALFYKTLEYKKYFYFIVPAIFYFLLMLFSIRREGEMGWYVIPLFPLMSACIAEMLLQGFQKKNWAIMILLLFIGFYEIQYFFELNFGLSVMQFRIMLLFMFLPVIVLTLWGSDKWFQRFSAGWFYFLILGNIFITFSYIHPA